MDIRNLGDLIDAAVATMVQEDPELQWLLKSDNVTQLKGGWTDGEAEEWIDKIKSGNYRLTVTTSSVHRGHYGPALEEV